MAILRLTIIFPPTISAGRGQITKFAKQPKALSRLRALFKSDLGLTPNQYVRKIKMDRAADLLRKTYRRVTEIAAILGFNDNIRFINYFKRAYGLTPTAYRKRHRRQAIREGGREGSVENIPPS